MTIALCINCGSLKFGALCPCEECGCGPTPAMSLDVAFTDHYLTENTLKRFGNLIRHLHSKTSDEALAFWAFMSFVSTYHPEIVLSDIPLKYQQSVATLLKSTQIPNVIVNDSDRIDAVEAAEPDSHLQYFSRRRHYQIDCKSCGSKRSYAIWSRISGGIDDWVKDYIRDGSLFASKCAACETVQYLPYDTLYVDIDPPIAIWLSYPHGKSVRRIDEPSKVYLEITSDFRLRKVSSLPELVEKIAIFEAEIDDIIVELAKLAISTQHGIAEPMYFYSLERSVFSGKTLVLRTPSNGETFRHSLRRNRSALEHILDKIRPIFDQSKDQWMTLDRDQILSVLEQSGMMRMINI